MDDLFELHFVKILDTLDSPYFLGRIVKFANEDFLKWRGYLPYNHNGSELNEYRVTSTILSGNKLYPFCIADYKRMRIPVRNQKVRFRIWHHNGKDYATSVIPINLPF